jgi:hypothetical protein
MLPRVFLLALLIQVALSAPIVKRAHTRKVDTDWIRMHAQRASINNREQIISAISDQISECKALEMKYDK